jgi:hypothetical protein
MATVDDSILQTMKQEARLLAETIGSLSTWSDEIEKVKQGIDFRASSTALLDWTVLDNFVCRARELEDKYHKLYKH